MYRFGLITGVCGSSLGSQGVHITFCSIFVFQRLPSALRLTDLASRTSLPTTMMCSSVFQLFPSQMQVVHRSSRLDRRVGSGVRYQTHSPNIAIWPL